MKATHARISNFRLLQDASIALDDETTMIVGRNNSGKTSVVEIFRKLVKTDVSAFTFDDLSISTHQTFEEALAAYDRYVTAFREENQEEVQASESIVRDLPTIELVLTITYEDDDDLSALAPFILDLDPNRTDATILFRTAVKDPIALFRAYREANNRKPIELLPYLRKNFTANARSTIEAIDVGDETNRRPISDTELRRLLSVKFIYAQNQIDDLSSDVGHGLSKGFESFYRSNQADNEIADKIADLLEGAGRDLDAQYKILFQSIYNDLEIFGVGRMPGLPQLSVVSELEAVRVLTGNAHLYYRDTGETKQLPEAHNGLGYSKLIFTILQFISFYEDLKRSVPEPPIQLIFLEEPEAHLHPQMQYVFVKSIGQFVKSKPEWNAQTIVTTHSSHMVAESGFSCIRYFDNSVSPMEVRDLSDFQAEQIKSDDGKAALQFLKQYMVLDRCDMFFADKIVLIEGAVERLLLPKMIQEVVPSLARQYLSVIEVGGAYAHLFRGIIEFLNVQTLIITDIDSVDPAANRRAAPVGSGLVSSNQTLTKWLPAEDDIDALLATTAAKIAGRVAVAYQVPEAIGDVVGRSFEEAFILANAAVIAAQKPFASGPAFEKDNGSSMSEAEIRADSWNISRAIDKKTDFAFDILQMNGWTVPRYIKEGLQWLNSIP
jgi:putative ATP-dependent endonuclease of the OLD family